MTTTVPLWATLAIAIGVALVTLAGVLVTQLVARRNVLVQVAQAREAAEEQIRLGRDRLTDEQAKRRHEMIMGAMGNLDLTRPGSVSVLIATLRSINAVRGITQDEAIFVGRMVIEISALDLPIAEARRLTTSERSFRIEQEQP